MASRMTDAIADVTQHHLSVRAAAEWHGIPKSTLHDKCNDLHTSPTFGRPTKLTPLEESVLISLARGHETFGRPYNPHTFLQLVREYEKKKRELIWLCTFAFRTL